MSVSRKKVKDLSLKETTTYQAGIVQSSVHRKLKKVSEDALAPFEISKMQWMIIGTVYDHRETGVRASDLARLIGTNASYMTNTINLLESKDILKRIKSEEDNRASLVTVHEKFVPKYKEVEACLRDTLKKEVYSKVTNEEFQTYLNVLAKLDS